MFSGRFLEEISHRSPGCGLLLGTDTVYLAEKTVLQEVSHNYGLREGPCQLFLVMGLGGRWFFCFLLFFHLKASHLGAGGRCLPGGSQPAPQQFQRLQVADGFRGMSQSTQAGESEILRSLVVFFHGFAVTINLFLLNKKNRCWGACWNTAAAPSSVLQPPGCPVA